MLEIPSQFKVYFWDTDLKTLDMLKYKTAIIERLLEFGNDEAYIWLFKNYSDAEIAEVVRRSRRISPTTATMLANFYGIPREDMRCFQETSFPKP